MPESMERTAPASAEIRVVMTLGPGLLLTLLAELRPFALLLLFLRGFLGMVLLQQRRNRLQEFVYLDRFVQNGNVVLPGIIRRLRRCITRQQHSRHAPASSPGGLNHFESGALLFQR